MKEYTIAVIPGDGIGPEVIAAGLEVLRTLEQKLGGFRLRVESFPWDSNYYKTHGVMMPKDGLDRLRLFSAIYFGAVGALDIPDHVTLWGLRLATCQGPDQYANLRPTRILPGLSSPLSNCNAGDLNWMPEANGASQCKICERCTRQPPAFHPCTSGYYCLKRADEARRKSENDST
jgi:tartrate dehydrogenase/decarboxylase / D-malate dehydrogenase